MSFKPWNVSWNLRNFFRLVRGKKSLEDERMERMTVLRELLAPTDPKMVRPAMSKEYFNKIADDFTVDSIVLAKRDGSEIISTNGGNSKTTKKCSLFEKISEEIPDTNYLLLKSKDKTHVFYPENGNLYLLETEGNISSIEVKALARKARKGVENS